MKILRKRLMKRVVMVRSQFGINLKLNVTLKMILRMMLVLSSPVPGSGQKRMIMMTMTRSPITDSGPPANCQTPPLAVGMTLMKKAYCQHPLHQHRQHTGRESRMMKRKMGERMSHTATCLVLNLIFLAQCPTCLTLNDYCIRIYFF